MANQDDGSTYLVHAGPLAVAQLGDSRAQAADQVLALFDSCDLADDLLDPLTAELSLHTPS